MKNTITIMSIMITQSMSMMRVTKYPPRAWNLFSEDSMEEEDLQERRSVSRR